MVIRPCPCPQTLEEEADHLQSWLRDILGAATWLQGQRKYLWAIHEQLVACKGDKPDAVREERPAASCLLGKRD